LCLVDEPNASDAVGEQILTVLAQQIGENDGMGNTSLDAAAMELAHSGWSQRLQVSLAKEFCQREAKVRWHPGGLCGMVGKEVIFSSSDASEQRLATLVESLDSSDELNAIIAALTIMNVALHGKFPNSLVFLVLEKLVTWLDNTPATANVVAEAMYWLARENNEEVVKWINHEANIQIILDGLTKPNFDVETIRLFVMFAENIKDSRAVELLMVKLSMAKLGDDDADVREEALGVLAKITGDDIDRKLLSGARYLWLDPKEPISHSHITEAVERLKLPREEIQRRYENLAKRFGLKLEWTAE
jgi:hypothetical protein